MAERYASIQRLPDQSPTSIRWADELSTEQRAPTFIFRIPKNQEDLKKAFGLAVFFTLTHDRLIRREYEDTAAAASSETIELNQLDVFYDAIKQRQQGQFEEEFNEAKAQAERAVQEVFGRIGVPYSIHYDYWQHMYRIGRDVSVLPASAGDNDHLFVAAPVSNLAGIEGIPYEVVYKRAEFGKGRRSRRESEQSAGYEELAQVVERFGYTREKMQTALMGDVLYSHAMDVLGFDKVMGLLKISSYYDLPEAERRRLMDTVTNMLSEEELTLLEQAQPHFLKAELTEPIEADNQKGLATLKFNVGYYDLHFDRQTKQLAGLPSNEHQISEAEFFVSPTVTDETTHQGLMALRQKGLARAASLGL